MPLLTPMSPIDSPPIAAFTPDPEPPALPNTMLTPSPEPPAPAIVEKPPVITYQSPNPDQPGFRIDGRSADSEFPSVFVLAPNHVGYTNQEQPVLYWYLSQPTQAPLDVMIAEEGNFEVLLDIRLLPPLQAGFHKLQLKDYGIRLLTDVPYRWTVRILTKQASEAITASGAIQRIQTQAGSSPSLVYSPKSYAQKGLWYNALAALAHLLQANPGNADLLTQRAVLLEQVGLTEAAAFVQQAKTP